LISSKPWRSAFQTRKFARFSHHTHFPLSSIYVLCPPGTALTANRLLSRVKKIAKRLWLVESMACWFLTIDMVITLNCTSFLTWSYVAPDYVYSFLPDGFSQVNLLRGLRGSGLRLPLPSFGFAPKRFDGVTIARYPDPVLTKSAILR